MAEAGGRAQDQGRVHRAKGRPSAETATLLASYQAAMRSELRDVLGELAPKVAGGLMPDAPATRPPIADRIRLWDLAIKIGRELGTEIDGSVATAGAQPPAPRKRSRARVDFG